MRRKSQEFFREQRKTVVVDWSLQAADSGAQRRALAERWLEEARYTSYRYNVERCFDGSRVYLLRPTPLNKGFDFQVNIERFRSKLRHARKNTLEMPSHGDVIHDLRLKVDEKPGLENELFDAICDIYDCQEVEEALRHHPKAARFRAGLPVDKVLRIIKWLFIEQDLTYWGWTGRNKFMRAIEEKAFRI
jgi:hypothetical protein